MGKKFEDYFTDLQADIISICLEYVDSGAEYIYAYGSIENRTKTNSFQVFYQINQKIVKMDEVNNAVLTNKPLFDTSIERQRAVLQIATEDLGKIASLCETYKRATPTQIRLFYDVQKNSLEANYKY